MKRPIIAGSVLAVMAVIGVSSSFAQAPSKVTGGGKFLDVGADGTTGSGELLSFTVNVNTDKRSDKKSPQVIIHVDGELVRDFWGGPLDLKGDFVGYKNLGDLFEPNDSKPPQQFLFVVDHPDPDIGKVNVWVFAHDNDTLYDPVLSGVFHWFGIWIEPENGDEYPNFYGWGDDLFTAVGIVTQGNIMDHRK